MSKWFNTPPEKRDVEDVEPLDVEPEKDAGEIPPPDTQTFPPARATLASIKSHLDPLSGVVRVARRQSDYGMFEWCAEADINAKSRGPDFKLEVRGGSLDEVSFALLDAIEQVLGAG